MDIHQRHSFVNRSAVLPGARRGRRRYTGSRGAALVELALLLPLLAVVVFGVVDVGRAYSLKNRIANMAREGAFYAQYHPSDVTGCTPSSITGVALGEDPAMTSATVTVTDGTTGTPVASRCGATPVPGTQVRVTVATPMRVLTPFLGLVVGDTVTMRSSTDVQVQG